MFVSTRSQKSPRIVPLASAAWHTTRMAIQERLFDIGHRLVVGGLVLTSTVGLTYIGFAGVDIYGRYKKFKELKAAEQKQQE